MDQALNVVSLKSHHLLNAGQRWKHRAGRYRRVNVDSSAGLFSPRQNRLLATLPDADYERLKPHLGLVSLASGTALHEAGSHPNFVYFPVSGVVSLLCVMENGAEPAIAITGNEGVVGISMFTGGVAAANRAVVQNAGHAYRLGANVLRREFERGGALSQTLWNYTHMLFNQMAQTAVCGRYHSVEQQLCRWLLLTLDRVTSNELLLTHEVIGSNIGVRRNSVTLAAIKLQEQGIIEYARGRISVLNREDLEERACECYGAANASNEPVGAMTRENQKVVRL